MNLGFVAVQIIIVSLPIALGWAAHKLGYMDDSFDVRLSRIVLNLCLPCSILSSLHSSGNALSQTDTFWVIAGETIMLGVAIALAYALTAFMHTPQESRGAYQFTVAFSNCSLIGFPIITALLGRDALLIASIALIPVNLMVFTTGVMMFAGGAGGAGKDRRKRLKQQLRGIAACCKSPTLIASFIVLICTLVGIRDIGVVGDSLAIVGQLTTPAALLLTGSSLASYKLRDMLSNWRAYVASGGRLLIAPLIGLALLRCLPISSSIATILVLEGAMPVGTNGILYSLQYGRDTEPMVQSTFLSVMGAVITIPIVIMIAAG